MDSGANAENIEISDSDSCTSEGDSDISEIIDDSEVGGNGLELFIDSLEMIKNGLQMQQTGVENLQQLIMCHPEHHEHLQCIGQHVSATYNVKATSSNENPKPKKLRKQLFYCSQCGKEKKVGNWASIDAHIRSEHTKIFYGPCPHCNKTYFHCDSYRSHLKKCFRRNKKKPNL